MADKQYEAPPGPPPQQQQYAQYQQNQQNQQQYMQPPPDYGMQNYGPAPDAFNNGEKPTFDQAFKVDKPKFNDWWAGLLMLAVFGGFVAVSGISLQGYGESFWRINQHV